MDNLAEAKNIERQYKEGLQYKKQMGFMNDWPEFERFRAYKQWPNPTEKTRNLPRPVLNILRYIQDHKVSSVINENVKMIFSTQEFFGEDEAAADQQLQMAAQGADLFTRYSDTLWENIKQDELNEEALENAAVLGTGVWHYYWDTSKQGGMLQPYIGEICGETIDPMNIFFGNPQQTKVQKQPYVLITSRELVSDVKKMAKENKVNQELIELIKPDKETQDEGYDMAQHEINDDSKVTVITKYWRENGLVYFAKVCSSVLVKPKTSTDMKLYPIIVMQWERRKKSIFGIGESEGIIPNQKAINFLMAMQLLSTQLTGWPKMKYTTGSINPNLVTNTPGEMIEMQPNSTVEYMVPGNSSHQAGELVETFMEQTKMLQSAHDVATGDIGKGEMNASAIMMLQKAAGVPIESIKKRFYRAIEEVGQVWEQFWKTKYNTNRRVTVEDDEGNPMPVNFNGSQYKDFDMNLKIDIGPSSAYSEELMMASLDKLYDKQAITIEDYLEFAPKNVVPFKDRLLKNIQKRMAEQAAMAQEQMMMQQQQMADMANQPQDIDIGAALKQLSPDEQKAYQMATPEQKQAILQQLLQTT